MQIKNKNILENIIIKRKEKKYNIIFNIIYIIYFYYIILNNIFSQFIKCYNRKIELASSYINLKVNGTGDINIFSQYYSGKWPDIVSINNTINLTGIYHYTFSNSENDINNITLIWNTSPSTTRGLFEYCDKIIEIDLSYFDTSQVNDMDIMFHGCSNLISLNLANINTSNVISMRNMFNSCSNLVSLDLSSFDTSQVHNTDKMFSGCSNLISLNLTNFDITSVTSMSSMLSGCNNLEYVNLINAKTNPNKISDSIFSNLSPNLFICSENKDWTKIISTDNLYVNCINNISYSNINENEPIAKCYKNNIQPNNPFQICGNKYFNKNGIINNTYINCYIIDDISEYSSFDSSIIIEIDIKNRIKLVQNVINNLFNKLNISYIDDGEDEISSINNISIIITSTKNQKKNENENIITMNLGQCEYILKNEYNISINDSLYISLIILEKEEGMKIPKVEYEVYYPFYNNNTLIKLDLNLCKRQKIEISIPVTINDNLDKYNPKSGYYNDICIKDRRNEFVDNNMTLCEENCDLINYNYTNEKVKSSCDIKININPNYDYKFNKNEFFKSFIDIKNIANINVLKCYKIVFKLNNLINN